MDVVDKFFALMNTSTEAQDDHLAPEPTYVEPVMEEQVTERLTEQVTEPAPEPTFTEVLTEPAPEPTVMEPERAAFTMPSKEYLIRGQRFTLLFHGVCSHCAHCGQPLTDSVSIERGLGPICSKKGYLEDPTNPDEMQAMLDLAEYPELVNYLVSEYKPKGVRGLMNGLVKICSLNRRSPVHQACTDAIESLGYKALASLLRESIAVVDIQDCKEHPGYYLVWVKRADFTWGWANALRTIKGNWRDRSLKGHLVPVSEKPALWEALLTHYHGLCAKVKLDGETKVVKLVRKKIAA